MRPTLILQINAWLVDPVQRPQNCPLTSMIFEVLSGTGVSIDAALMV